MFHLHSLKEPPPKRMFETINFTSEVEATISNQETQRFKEHQVSECHKIAIDYEVIKEVITLCKLILVKRG